jgi:hypothetical protein
MSHLTFQEQKLIKDTLFSETHVGYETTVDVENFFYYPFCRQKFKNNRYFGGLGILIKKDIRKGIQFLVYKVLIVQFITFLCDESSHIPRAETDKRHFIFGLHAIKLLKYTHFVNYY